MRKQVSVTIEGWTYELAQVGAVEGRALVLRFLKLLGRFAPMLAALGDTVKAAKTEDGSAPENDPTEAIEEIGAALTNIDGGELEPLWDAFAKHATVRGQDGKTRQNLAEVFDEHFAGEYFAMVRFFIESAKLNFGDFLGKALAQAGSPKKSAATP